MKSFFRTEWGKLRVMTFAEKRQYIWEYYKIHMLVGGFLILVFGSLFYTWFINPPLRDYLYIAWVGDEAHSQTLADIGEALTTIVENPARERVYVASYALTGNPGMDNMLQQRFIAMLQTSSLDLYLTNLDGVQELAETGFSRPVGDIMHSVARLDPGLHRLVSESLVTITFELDGNEYTDGMGIYLADTPLFEHLEIDANGLYLAVVSNTLNFHRIAKALEAIFLWNQQTETF